MSNKEFIFENICDSDSNFTTQNLKKIVSVLSQLSIVNIDTDDSETLNKLESILKNNKNKYFIVVKYNNEIIGTGSVLIEQKIIHNMGLVGHIEDVVIDNNYRGLGLAKKLIYYLIDICKSIGCYKIILNASKDVEEFYNKCGFETYDCGMKIYFS